MYEIWVTYRAWLKIKQKRCSLLIWLKDYLTKQQVHSQCFSLLAELHDPYSIGHAALFKNTLRVGREIMTVTLYYLVQGTY